MNFYKAWNYLNNHPIFKDKYNHSRFQDCLDIEVVKVNKKKNKIDDNLKKNTSTRIWLEAGPYVEDIPTHDYSLDCGAKTFEKAIIKLAKLVKKHYGNDKEKALKIVNDKYISKTKISYEGIVIPDENLYYETEVSKEEYHQMTLDEYSKDLEISKNQVEIISDTKEEKSED